MTLAPAEVFGAVNVYVRGVEYTAPSRQGLLTKRYMKLPPDYTKP